MWPSPISRMRGPLRCALRSVKSLYDSTYADESLDRGGREPHPRMKDIIARKAPGTKLAITEYNWGNDAGLSSALAQAEVLGVYRRPRGGRRNRWVVPLPALRWRNAFALTWITTAPGLVGGRQRRRRFLPGGRGGGLRVPRSRRIPAGDSYQ